METELLSEILKHIDNLVALLILVATLTGANLILLIVLCLKQRKQRDSFVSDYNDLKPKKPKHKHKKATQELQGRTFDEDLDIDLDDLDFSDLEDDLKK